LQLLVEQGLQIVPRRLGRWRRSRIGRNAWSRGLEGAAPGSVASGAEGRAVGNPVEPAGKSVRLANGTSPEGEKEESRLQRFVGIGVVAQDIPAHISHQPSVATNEFGKGPLVALFSEESKQLPIRAAALGGSTRNGPQLVDEGAQGCVSHNGSLPESICPNGSPLIGSEAPFLQYFPLDRFRVCFFSRPSHAEWHE
jgi:hypothetical protein